MSNQVYRWSVKKGNVLVQKNQHHISLELDYENGDRCLLTYKDANEIIELLTSIAQQIWQDPTYVKNPYTKLYQVNDGEYYWDINNSRLIVKYNDEEDFVEIRYSGSGKFDLEVNYAIEIIQVLEKLNS